MMFNSSYNKIPDFRRFKKYVTIYSQTTIDGLSCLNSTFVILK